ncbi:MAG TPA: tripartite tricarboxylate transporter TctB family protein [Castellaniella sp.]|jgi:putative tricarboxylic transport membrane protein|nr:tripartite tricarboxylate transporter TctB family protein [Castellaniella sp.]
MKVSDVLTGILLAIFGIAVVLYSQTFPVIPGQDFGPRAFPSIIGVGFILCSLFLIRNGLRAQPRAAWLRLSNEFRSSHSVFRFLLVPIMIVLYMLFSDSIGFVVFSVFFLLVLFLAFGVRPVPAVVIAALGGVIIFYGFYSLLHVPLSWGLLEPFL